MKKHTIKESITNVVEKDIYTDKIQELIYCKDCKHYHKDLFCNLCLNENSVLCEVEPEDFCSRAERREE